MEAPNNTEAATLIRDIAGFMGSLMRESERAAVILAAARLDVDLEALLKHVLHRHPGGTDPLFDTDRALGTFSAKIAMAHRLGILSPDFEHALQMLRKIRNDFAHELELEALGSPKQRQRLDNLIKWAAKSELYDAQMTILREDARTLEQAQFVACTICMAVLLKRGLVTLVRVNVGMPLTF